MKTENRGIKKGTKRGPYKRSQRKNEQKEFQGDGLNHHQISSLLDISVEEVKRIENQAFLKLKAPSEKNKKFHRYLGI